MQILRALIPEYMYTNIQYGFNSDIHILSYSLDHSMWIKQTHEFYKQHNCVLTNSVDL